MSFDPADQNLARALRPPSQAPWVLMFLTLGAAGAGGAWLWGETGKAKAAAAAAEVRINAVEAKRAALAPQAERAAKLEAENADLKVAKETLEHDKEALAHDVEAKTGELAALKGTADKLQAQMKEEIARGDVRLTESGGKLRVDLVDKILFESGEATISGRGEGVLARVGAVLAQIDDKTIQVSGHTDNLPLGDKLTAQFPTNWELSAARAVTVVRFLTEKANVPPQRLVASGYGEWSPLASNRSASGRARNRRIEILLTPALAPKPMARGKLAEVADAHAGRKAKAKK
ncbi:MAG TPA: OmpA family protein [Polyangia bacterium]|jgi:chemotaxis protein MotB|nr:OmpA family protein [Polyangia bacterium]